jgi:hypothetical protein
MNFNIGIGAMPSKTEAMYVPPSRRLYADADTSRLDVLDDVGNPVGFIDFATQLKYLDSTFHHSLISDADVAKRIKSASAAFGAFRNILTNTHIDLKVKGRTYLALFLSIKLYSCEVFDALDLCAV